MKVFIEIASNDFLFFFLKSKYHFPFVAGAHTHFNYMNYSFSF